MKMILLKTGFAFVFLVLVFSVHVFAASGSIGDNLNWNIDSNGNLVISGNGQMALTSTLNNPFTEYSESVKSIVVQEGVTSIGNFAFYNLKKVVSVSIPNSLQSIGSSSFYGCSSLEEVIISPSVKTIEIGTFADCKSLKKVELSNVEKIEDRAFYGCESLNSITLPKTLNEIGLSAFENCTLLNNIEILNNECVFKGNTFKNTAWSKSQGDFAILNNVLLNYNGSDTKVVIPDSVDIIGSYAFFQNENIEEVIMPNSVKEIKDRAFLDCKKLKSVEFSKNLVSIGEYAFSGCEYLEEVAIPKNTTRAENAFDEDVDVITTGQKVLNNITKGFFKHFFIYNALIIGFGIVIPVYISRKRGEDGHLSSEYLKEHKFTSIAYYIAIGFAVLFMIPLMHMLIGDTYSDFIEGTLFTFALGGFLISSIIWMLMEIIRSDFPWGISRVLIRLGKLILITTISIIPIAILTVILDGITLQVVLYVFAAIVFIVLLSVIDYLIPSSPSSGSSGITPPGVGESSRSFWDIINSSDDEKDPTFIQYGDMSEMPNFTYSKNGNFVHTRDMDGRERNLYKYDEGHYKDEDTGEDFFIKD